MGVKIMISKNKILTAILVTIIGTFSFGITQVHAQTSNNPFSGLIQFISQKFGLDQSKVSSAVADYKSKQKQNFQLNLEQNEKKRLDTLVSQGNINSNQEQAIITELALLKTKYNPTNFNNLTAAQRKQQRTQEQTEINAWAKSKNIDPKYILPGFGRGFRGMHMRWKVTPTPTP
jgi:hypothetical protein